MTLGNIVLFMLLLWILVTLGAAVALLALLAVDEWQVRSRTAAPKAARPEASQTAKVPQLA